MHPALVPFIIFIHYLQLNLLFSEIHSYRIMYILAAFAPPLLQPCLARQELTSDPSLSSCLSGLYRSWPFIINMLISPKPLNQSTSNKKVTPITFYSESIFFFNFEKEGKKSPPLKTKKND